MMKLIIDENISLELIAANHAGRLFSIVDSNRVHLSRFLPWVNNMRSVADFSKYIQDCETLYQQNKEVSFVIMFGNNMVGRIGLHHLNMQNKIGVIGYWLDERFERQGIIAKSCIALIDYGFKQLDLNRIEVKAATENVKSQAIPIKLNFVKEGILREAEWVNNKFVDLVLYSMLKKEWTAR